MKNKGILYFFALSLAVGSCLAAFRPDDVPPGEKESIIIQTMMQNLARHHYQPMDIDDDFSARAYDYYLDDVDGSRLFFTQQDIDAFAKHRVDIDDQISAGNYAFFDEVQARWLANLDVRQKYYREILAQPIDLDRDGEMTLRDDDDGWLADEDRLMKYWKDYVTRDVVNQITNQLEENEEDEDLTEKPTLAEVEKEVRGETLERYDKWFERMRKSKLSIRRSQYLNALTSMFDPHTSYFRPRDKESFDIRFSGRLEGIGATLQTEDTYTKVASLVVGGPAWKDGELKADDVIMAVRQGGEDTITDIKAMPVEDVVTYIRGKKGTTVHLKIKKPEGEIKWIDIVRDVVVIDDRFAKSLIIDGPNEEKIGYINLPSFYADFQNPDGRFCSKDVKAELEKLKAQNVEGVVLDLRNNGGGSLEDVVDMTGYFIPEGPVVQTSGRDGRGRQQLRDDDPGVVYGGPLVILVNQYSASASEIIAAALQDYQRAVIVGSESTFGKGTVQRFVNLDRLIPGRNDVKPLGTVKLTMQKFYRINGGSTQLKGVESDIVLPDNRALLETGERQRTSPLPWTRIDAVEYDQDTYVISEAEMSRLQALSNARVAASPTFTRVLENAKRVKRQSDRDTYPLALDDYQELTRANKTEAEMYKDLFEDVVNPGVFNIEVDLEAIMVDESKEARNQEFKENVSKDIYIREAANIIADMRMEKVGLRE